MILLAVDGRARGWPFGGAAAWAFRPEVILSLAFWMILPAIVGARAFYVTEYWSEQYWPVYAEEGLAALLGAVVNVTKGGLVIYGGFFGGVVGLLAFFWKYRVPLLATADLVAPSLMLGLAIGRIGCLLNGCCYGGPCDLPWAVSFPAGSPAYVSQVARGVMYGLSLSGDPKAAPIVQTVLPTRRPSHAGLRPGDRLRRIGECKRTPARCRRPRSCSAICSTSERPSLSTWNRRTGGSSGSRPSRPRPIAIRSIPRSSTARSARC